MILALIQIGGLGIMSAATLLVLLIGRRLSAPAAVLTGAESRSIAHRSPGQVLVGVVQFTLAVEAATTIALALRLRVAYHEDWGTALYSGFFHAISAFNNAGFGLHSDSAVEWVQDPWMCLPIMASVMIGGLGFPVWWEICRHWRKQFRRWTIHAMITIGGSLVLWFGGTALFAVFEWRNEATLGPLSTGGKILAAAFQSVVARTAGFNSIDIGGLHQESLLLLDGLMFIGGGSAGTAGGITISTFALLGFVIWAELRGEPTVRIFHRRLSPANMCQALTVALLGVGMIVAATAVLLVVTPFRLDAVLFEAISAFATVGMSTGITPDVPHRTSRAHPADVLRPDRAHHLGRRPSDLDASRSPKNGSSLAKYDIAVIGLGRFGSSLALRLEEEGRRVLGVDVDEAVVNSLAEGIRDLAIAEARDEETLRQLDITPDTLVMLGMNHAAASLMTATALNELGVHEVWAKGGSRQHYEALSRLGVTRIIQPEKEAGLTMAADILRR